MKNFIEKMEYFIEQGYKYPDMAIIRSRGYAGRNQFVGRIIDVYVIKNNEIQWMGQCTNKPVRWIIEQE